MAIIIDINEYKKGKQHEVDMTKLSEMIEIFFTNGPRVLNEEQARFMIELSDLSALEESV